jgi:paired amphipathic helix protein Sin3a
MNSRPADDLSLRDRESAERHHREQFPVPSGTPHHSNAGSLPIHQPVASRIPGAIHSPSGILATHGSAPSGSLGGPPSSVNAFGGGPLSESSNRLGAHNAQNASNKMFGVIGAAASTPGQPAPAASAGTVFGGPLQSDNNRPPTQGMPFGGGGGGNGGGGAMPGGQPMPSGAGSLQQGQQPILNVSQFCSTNRRNDGGCGCEITLTS